jgi:hypothetical protein
MSLCYVLELNDVLFVPGLKKNILSISYVIDFQCRVAFEGKHCIINACSVVCTRTLAIGV